MKISSRLFAFVILGSAILCCGLLIAPRAQNEPPHARANGPDVDKFPLADYTVEKSRAKTNSRGRKHNLQYAPRIGEDSNGIFTIDDWDVGLPALPISRSCAIIVGQVIDAAAHLSEDETNIYSEFTVKVDQVLKSDDSIRLVPGNTVTVERSGGRVRLPSGRIVTAQTNHQDLPQVAKRYAFFLTHQFSNSVSNEEFKILTAYELRAGRVFPLDKVLPGHPITAYSNASESVFFEDLIRSIRANSP